MKPIAILAVMLMAVSPVLAAPAGGQVHVIVNIDVMPDHAAAGARVLNDYVRMERRAAGVESLVLILQAGTANHFILDETFADKAAYEKFVQSAPVRAFRTQLFAHLGSPWDERLGQDQP